ncbi:MAG: PocR ligand-binding domain-containing protein, partial [Bacteroidales bacterium]|nr:PocR ligand-binding domain-containing protein [Bacteroidales bacterium]
MNSGNNLIEGKYKFSDIVDVKRLTDIFSKFSEATGFTIGLVDNNSLEVLVKTGWHDICVNFHRADEKACKVCKKSNKILFKDLNQEKSVRIVECEHGLYDCATPIIIEGKHVANLVTGQLLMQKPDIKQFEEQAKTFNFNRQKYLEALNKVPIVNKKDVTEMMDYLAELAIYIAEKGLDKLRTNKLNEALLKAKEKAEESERKLKEAQQISHLGHWELDLVNNKLVWSDEIYRIFNLKPQEFGATYEAFLENIHPDDRNKVNEAYTGSLKDKTPYEIEHRLLLKTGELKHVLEKCNTEFDKHGNPIRSMGTVLDITPLKKTEQELIKAKEKAEESGRLKSAFLANMSHEVRTPLNAVLGFSNLLMRGNLTKEKKEEIIRHISDGCNSMFVIISDIIDVSKIDANQLSINNEECNLNLLLNRLQNQFSISNINKKISVRARILLNDEGCNIITDETRLNQILSNLIENALKFTKEGVVEFGYEIKAGMIHFYVKDTGIGIKPDHHELIFDRFRQIDNNYAGLGTGTGLGLSIVKGLLGLLKGEIWLESEINKGTTFHFTIPYI